MRITPFRGGCLHTRYKFVSLRSPGRGRLGDCPDFQDRPVPSRRVRRQVSAHQPKMKEREQQTN